MAFTKEVSMGVGQGQRTWQVPPLASLWVWHGMGTENHSTEREAAEAGKSFRAKPKTGVSPESPRSRPVRQHNGEVSPLGFLYSIHGTFSNTAVVGTLLGGTQITQNNI